MKSRVIDSHSVATGLVIAMISTVLLLFYFWFGETTYLSYRNIPFPPMVSSVHAGQNVPLMVERCNRDSVHHNYLTTHSIQNVKSLETILLPQVTMIIPPGCTSSISLINKVPYETPPGQYIVFGTAETRGTLRNFFVDWRSQEFEVIPKE